MAVERSMNEIDAVDSSGNLITKSKDISGQIVNKKKKLMRLPNNNTRKADIAMDNISDTDYYIEINKTNLDTTAFTMNKEYWISFKDGSDGPSGAYVLGKKTDIYTRFEDNFMCTTKLLFY